MRCILRRCGVPPRMPHFSGFLRLASGAFYPAIVLATFYEIIRGMRLQLFTSWPWPSGQGCSA
ncbi:MAG: hypothetical protein NTY64_12855 [Deltaproteobacteria bacterium]|nr:hypothetical protein [Deltaproteobacteria bacterium]